jgi:putative membrane protein
VSGPTERSYGLTPLLRAVQVAPGWAAAVVFVPVFGFAWTPVGILRGVSIVALLTGVSAAWFVISWSRTTFGFDADGDFRIESGVVNRQHSRVQSSRVQSVDIRTPLLARPFGLTEVVIDVAGSGRSTQKVAYVTAARAHQIRDGLLRRAADLHQPVVLQDTLLVVPAGRLVVATLARVSTLGLVAATVLVLGIVVLTNGWGGLPIAVITGGLPIFTVVQQFVRYHGFTLTRADDGLRVRSGLASTEQRTIPPDRVQAVEIVEPLVWRRLGWVRIRLNVAGLGAVSATNETVLAPVAPRGDVPALLAQVLPGVDVDTLPWVGAPARARWRSPVQYALLAVAWTDTVIAVRHGRLTRQVAVAPHARVQSVRWTQGPWQRALGLATMHSDSTPGPVRLSAPHLDAAIAWEVAAEEAVRARLARPQGRSNLRSVVAVEGGIEAAPGSAAGQGLEGTGEGIAPEQQSVGPGELGRLDDGAIGQGHPGAGGDVRARFDDAVVAEADADAGIRPDEATGSDGDDGRATP